MLVFSILLLCFFCTLHYFLLFSILTLTFSLMLNSYLLTFPDTPFSLIPYFMQTFIHSLPLICPLHSLLPPHPHFIKQGSFSAIAGQYPLSNLRCYYFYLDILSCLLIYTSYYSILASLPPCNLTVYLSSLSYYSRLFLPSPLLLKPIFNPLYFYSFSLSIFMRVV